MTTKMADAILDEMIDWWKNILDDYSPKDENDNRIDCVAEAMFLLSTQYLIMNDYSREELFNDLDKQFELYSNEE